MQHHLLLDWDLDDAFAASGERNVATLYEYWAFLQLAKSIGRVCGADLSALVMERSNDGMSLGFPRGRRSRLTWALVGRGRNLTADLYFNREFLVSSRPDSSWTHAMRPDCWLRLRPDGLAGGIAADELAMWLHFDAKYRVEFVDEQFAPPDELDGTRAAEAEAVERLARSRREDLLKMHAYRDAIRGRRGPTSSIPATSNAPRSWSTTRCCRGLEPFRCVQAPLDRSARWHSIGS